MFFYKNKKKEKILRVLNYSYFSFVLEAIEKLLENKENNLNSTCSSDFSALTSEYCPSIDSSSVSR